MALRSFSFSRCTVAAITALGLAGACAGYIVLDIEQRKVIFQPDARIWHRSNTDGMTEVWIPFRSPSSHQRVRLHGLWLPHASPHAPVMLYLHGRRWNLTAATERMRNMHSLGFSVLAIDYRGFGQTTPSHLPTQTSVHEDALAAWEWLRTHYPQQQRVIFGHSLGGAIAVQLAAQVPDEQLLLLEGSFTSIADMARSYPWGWLLVEPLVTQKFDSRAQIAHVGSPVVIVHGDADRLIPSSHAHALYAAAQAPKQLAIVPGGTHHSTNTQALPQLRAALTDGLTAP